MTTLTRRARTCLVLLEVLRAVPRESNAAGEASNPGSKEVCVSEEILVVDPVAVDEVGKI